MLEREHSQELRDIRNRIRADLKPVRPLQSERLCLGASLGFILVSSAILFFVFGPRHDSEALGAFWMWGPSVFEAVVALIALGLAMGESLPGRGSSLLFLWLTAGAGLTCHIVTSFVVAARSLVPLPESGALSIDVRDFGMMLCLGITMLLAATWIAQRGFTARTGRVGLMVGFGAGLAADAVWRLFCPFSQVGHVFVSHTLNIAGVMLVGWCLAVWWRRRMSIWRSSPRGDVKADPVSY